jgi:hypothetical protein
MVPQNCYPEDDSVGELTERRPLCGSRGAPQVPRLPPDFLSGLVVSVNLMRLSSKKAAYVVVDESSVVGNPEYAPNDTGGSGPRFSAAPTALPRQAGAGRSFWGSVPSPPPDFLWNLVALANFMRLSLKKAAYVASSSAAWQEIRVPGWAEVWRPALRASHHRRSWSVISLSTCFKQVGCSG